MASFGDSLTDDLLIGGAGRPGTRSVQSDSVVKSSSRLRWMLIGLATFGVLIVGLAQWPKSEPPPESAAQTDAETDDRVDEPRPPTTLAPAGTTVQPSSSRSNNRNQDDDDPESAAAVTSTSPPGPILGEATGLGLVTVSNQGRLQLTDLDTGEAVEYPAVRGEPAGVIGDKLIVQSDNGRLLLADLTDPESAGTRVGESSGGYHQLISIHDDVFWVLTEGPTNDLPVLEAYNADGELVDESRIENDEQLFSLYSGGRSADLVQSSGGIYQRQGTGFQLVVNGSLLTSSDRMALVRSCDERMRCQAAWYDRSNWERPLDSPVPDLLQWGRFAIAGPDRWLIQTDWSDGATTVVEIESGRVTRTMESNPALYNGLDIPMSPDGRWLLDRETERRMIVDMDSGVEFELDLGAGFREGSHAVFLDMDDLGSG